MDAPPSTAGQRVCHADFPSVFLGNSRPIIVHLPPGYDAQATRRYPVLYLHDGQNLFDPSAAPFGVSWQADITADRLALARRTTAPILVAIGNTPARLDEYAFWYDSGEEAGGRGALYGRFLFEELKPFIDHHYRTRPGRKHTAITGASLGGLASLTLARDYHDRFVLCGALSPSLWWADGAILREWAGGAAWMRKVRFWLDIGTLEDWGRVAAVPECVEDARRLVSHFDDAGLVPGKDYYYWEVTGGEHNEAAWGARFDKLLLYFFGR